MQRIKEHAGFLFIFAACVILRFIPFFDYQFTFDELSGLDRTQFQTTSEVLEKGVKIDAHPALVQLVIFWLSRMFGYVNWIIKLPFLLCSLGAVIYAYLFGLRFLSKSAGLFAASVFSFSLIFVFYAPIARMYITGVFFSLGLLYHFYKIIFSDSAWRVDYFGLGLFALLSALNQHVNALFAFTVCLSGCFFLTRKIWKPYLFSCLLAVLFYLPHLPITMYQLSVPGIGRDAGGWLEVPEWTVIFSFLKILLGTGYVWLAVLMIALSSLAMKGSNAPRTIFLLPILFVINFLVVYLYSVFKSPIYQHSVMLFSATGLVLFISAFFYFENKKVNYFFISVTALIFCIQTYGVKEYHSECVKTVYEYQFERTAQIEKAYGRGKVAAVFFDCDTLMRKIYYKKHNCGFEFKMSHDSIVSFAERRVFEPTGVSSISLFSQYIAKQQSDYLALSSSTPLYERIVQQYFPYLVENTQTQAVYYKLFSKHKPETFADSDVLLQVPAALNTPEKFPMHIDSLNEFPHGVKCEARELNALPGAMLVVETTVLPENNKAGELESVISLTDSTGQTFSYGARQLNDFKEDKSKTILVSEHFLGTSYETHKDDAQINCYLWNKAKGKCQVLKHEGLLVDYWHNKWNFWK